jgi:hypothetical protein
MNERHDSHAGNEVQQTLMWQQYSKVASVFPIYSALAARCTTSAAGCFKAGGLCCCKATHQCVCNVLLISTWGMCHGFGVVPTGMHANSSVTYVTAVLYMFWIRDAKMRTRNRMVQML